MNEKRKDAVKLTARPSDFEVLPSKDGYANLVLEGLLYDSQSEEERIFSPDSLYVKLICESDGSLAFPMTKIEALDSSFKAELCGIPPGGPYTVDFVMLDNVFCNGCINTGNS